MGFERPERGRDLHIADDDVRMALRSEHGAGRCEQDGVRRHRDGQQRQRIELDARFPRHAIGHDAEQAGRRQSAGADTRVYRNAHQHGVHTGAPRDRHADRRQHEAGLRRSHRRHDA